MPYAIVSGGFDPIHSGHIQLIRDAAEHGDVIVALNSDNWLARKKGRPFMSWDERRVILENINGVIDVIAFDDIDNTACHALRIIRNMYPGAPLYFCNGGDRTPNATPEKEVASELGIICLFGVGGDYKKQSSSTLLADWTARNRHRIG